MKIETKFFGEIDLNEDSIIVFDQGIMGFEEYKKFTLLHDSGDDTVLIHWLQSVEEKELALPLVETHRLYEGYNPILDPHKISSLDLEKAEDMVVLSTLTVPSNIELMTMNLKAPIIINPTNNKGVQVIVDEDYDIKFKVYGSITKLRKEKGV